MENVNAVVTISLDGSVNGGDRNFVLLNPAFDELMSEGATVSTSDFKLQAGGASC